MVILYIETDFAYINAYLHECVCICVIYLYIYRYTNVENSTGTLLHFLFQYLYIVSNVAGCYTVA